MSPPPPLSALCLIGAPRFGSTSVGIKTECTPLPTITPRLDRAVNPMARARQ